MSRIRAKNTQPEKLVRSLLHRLGYRFRLHVSDLPGHPDIVLPKWRKVILVHGCFWHRHPACRLAYTPKSRRRFWQKKFRQNVLRDRANMKELGVRGWDVCVIWECETEDRQLLSERLRAFFASASATTRRRDRTGRVETRRKMLYLQ